MRLIFKFFYNIFDNFLHKPRLKKCLLKLDLSCKNIFDVGSHNGESIDFLKSLYSDSKFYGFEPQKDCFKILKKKYLNSRKIKILNYALGKKKEEKKMWKNVLSTTSTLSNLNNNSKHFKTKSLILGNTKAGFYTKEKVKINTLFFFFKKFKLNELDIVKIDTEGYEIKVLLGLNKIANKIKVIIIEHNFTDYYKDYNLSAIKKFLKKNSFKNIENLKFPFMKYTDSIYINKKFFQNKI